MIENCKTCKFAHDNWSPCDKPECYGTDHAYYEPKEEQTCMNCNPTKTIMPIVDYDFNPKGIVENEVYRGKVAQCDADLKKHLEIRIKDMEYIASLEHDIQSINQRHKNNLNEIANSLTEWRKDLRRNNIQMKINVLDVLIAGIREGKPNG